MPVTSTTNRVEYAGNGSTTVFAVGFYFLAEEDLKVYIRTSAGVETLQTLTTHYTTTGEGVPAGGSVTMVTAPASGEKLVIIRDPALTQPTDYLENDAFPAETHERALDRLTMQAQRLAERIDRSISLDESSDSSDLTLPEPSSNLDRFIKINAAGDGLEAVAASDAAIVDLSEFLEERIFVSTIAGLKALDITEVTASTVTASGRGGTFVWRAGDYSSEIAADTEDGVYVKADDVAASAGAWVRLDFLQGKPMQIEWFGLATSNTGAQNVTAFNAMGTLASHFGFADVRVGVGVFEFNAGVSVSHNSSDTGFQLIGSGVDQTVFKFTGSAGMLIVMKQVAGAGDASRAIIKDLTFETDTEGTCAYGLRLDGQNAGGSDADAGPIVSEIAFRGTLASDYFVIGLDVLDYGRSTISNVEYSGSQQSTPTVDNVLGTAFKFNRVGNHKMSGVNVQIAEIGIDIAGDVEGVLCSLCTMVAVVKGIVWNPDTAGETYLEYIGGHINALETCVEVEDCPRILIQGVLFTHFAQWTNDRDFTNIKLTTCYDVIICDSVLSVSPGASPSINHTGLHLYGCNQLKIDNNLLTTGETNHVSLGDGMFLEGEGALLVSSHRNVKISNNTIRGFTNGIRTGSANGVPRTANINNNLFDQCGTCIAIGATATIRSSTITLDDNFFVRTTGELVTSDSVEKLIARRNTAQPDTVSMSGTNFRFVDTFAAAAKQAYFSGNKWASGEGVDITNIGNCVVTGDDDNELVLRSRVSGDIAIAATSVTLNHGLTITPDEEDFIITPVGTNAAAHSFSVSNATSTQITVNMDSTDAAAVTVAVNVDLSL